MWATILSVVLGLAVNEFCDLSPWAAKKIVRWSARLRYGISEQAEIRAEELAALIEQRPGQLFKLITALCFAVAALRAWARRAASALQAGIPTAAADGTLMVKKAAIVVVSTAAAATGTFAVETALFHASPPVTGAPVMQTGYPVVLQVWPETGANMGITVKALEKLDANRTYLVVEEIPDVDPTNPHSVYFVRATLPHLSVNQASHLFFAIKESVRTRTMFMVVSADKSGIEAMSQNQVGDNGTLSLPPDIIVESRVSWHPTTERPRALVD